MKHAARGVTLIELMVVIVSVMLLACILFNINPFAKRRYANQVRCVNNLKQLVTSCHIYSDVATNNGVFPTDGMPAGVGNLDSLNLLFDQYAADYKMFSCVETPRPSLKQLKPATKISEANLSRSMTSYGYDKTHGPTHPSSIVLADFSSNPVVNSTNHGLSPSGTGAGQYVADAGGSGRFMSTPSFIQSQQANGQPGLTDNIFEPDPALGALDSYIGL